MVNSAGVVAADYLAPVDLNFGTATLTQTAQALVNRGLVTDSTSTIDPTPANRFTVGYMAAGSADLAVVALADLVDALETIGVLEPSTVIDPFYEGAAAQPATLAALLTALEAKGYLNNTA